MFSSQDSFLLGVTLSSTGLSLIHTLHTEFNMFVKSKNKNLSKKEENIEVIKNFFQLVSLKSREKIDQEKFLTLLRKWSKDKRCYLRNSTFFEVEQTNEYSVDDILKALLIIPLQDKGEYITFLTSCVVVLNNEYNHFLQKTSNVGFNCNGDSIKAIHKDTLDLMDQIFHIFDHKGTGNIQADRLFFLYLALLCCQPNPSFQVNKATFLRDINSSFDCFLKRISCFHGRITSRQFKAYLIFNNLTSNESLETLYNSAKFVAELGPKINENLQQNTETRLPSLLLIAIKQTLPKVTLSDLRKNTLDIQLLCHCLLTRFFQIAYENNHFKGLCVVRKTLLSQFFLKHLRESYPVDLNAVYWRFHLSQTILTIVQNYTHIAIETLRSSLIWLLSQKNCPFQKPILSPNSIVGNRFIWSEDKPTKPNTKSPQNKEKKEIKQDILKRDSPSPKKTKILSVETVEIKEEPSRIWQTNFLDASPKPSRNQSPKLAEGKARSIVEQDVILEATEKKRRTTTTSIMSKKSQSRRETSETSKNFMEENSRITKANIHELTMSPVTGTLVDQVEDQEPRKLSGRFQLERRATKVEETKWHYRDNSEINLIDVIRELRADPAKSTSPNKNRFVVRKEDVALIDQSEKIVIKEKPKIQVWEEIEKMRSQNSKAWNYGKVLLENITKESRKTTPTASSLERIKGIFRSISPKEHVKYNSESDSEVSGEGNETDFSNQRETRGDKEPRFIEKDYYFKK